MTPRAAATLVHSVPKMSIASMDSALSIITLATISGDPLARFNFIHLHHGVHGSAPHNTGCLAESNTAMAKSCPA